MPPKKTATVVVKEPETAIIVTQTSTLEEQAAAIVVSDKKSADKAAELRSSAKTLLAQVNDTFDPSIGDAFKLHRGLIATKKKFATPIEEVISGLGFRLSRYANEQEALRLAEQRKLQEQARRDQEEAALAQAALYQQQGNEEAAEEVMRDAIESDAPTVIVPREKIEGVSFRKVVKWEITDITKIPLNFLQIARNPSNGLNQEISTSGLGAYIRSQGVSAMKVIQGVRVWEDSTTV